MPFPDFLYDIIIFFKYSNAFSILLIVYMYLYIIGVLEHAKNRLAMVVPILELAVGSSYLSMLFYLILNYLLWMPHCVCIVKEKNSVRELRALVGFKGVLSCLFDLPAAGGSVRI